MDVLHPRYSVTVKMQDCHQQCQSGNSGNVGTTDWVESCWKWATGKSKLDRSPMKVSFARGTWGGDCFCTGVHWDSFSKTRLKWGEGVQSATSPSSSPPPTILTARTLVHPTVASISFSPPPSDKKQFHMCVATALMRGEARLIFHTNCVLNPITCLDEL